MRSHHCLVAILVPCQACDELGPQSSFNYSHSENYSKTPVFFPSAIQLTAILAAIKKVDAAEIRLDNNVKVTATALIIFLLHKLYSNSPIEKDLNMAKL